MKKYGKSKLGLFLVSSLLLVGCDDNNDQIPVVSETFTVRIENVSTENLINTTRANGAVPLSQGVYAVYESVNPMFTIGIDKKSDAALELMAEDGVTTLLLNQLASMKTIISGLFEAPGGPDNSTALFPGEEATFTFEASPGDELQIITMFMQSNDWFYAFRRNGLDLFDGLEAIDGDVTSELVLYDAGTEDDTAPGTGPDQKLAQDPSVTNQGPRDPLNQIHPAVGSHPEYTIPETASVIKVTITHD
ncbi:spondin domain-containing protein [Pontibacter cellulosilyticus]|uniref:Spondin domain-containing protein n=1 Tax=Pontibacter cellulosilyticus TaxID=1720253 RepID=A0A923N950_9BACT|nr:spondin domain-containing protein [Pontibacter cellulosilyticus]MBC5993167.1 spondin domain-containing protein [Pontibacter cellulosilyticus]